MVKNLPARHHYVPKLLVKSFADSNKQVLYCEKENPRIEIRNYRTPFWSRHYYTARNEKNEKDVSAEYSFGEFENIVAPIVEGIRISIGEGKTPRLSAEEKRIWDCFFILQLQRTPEGFKRLVKEESLTGTTEDCFEQWMADEPDKSDEIRTYCTPENIERLMNTIRIGAQTMVGPNSLELFSKLELSFWILTGKNRSFVLGSNPIARLSAHSNNGWGNWLPVSPKIAVSHTLKGTRGSVLQNNRTEDVRRLNMVIIDQSSAVVSNSEKLLKSLTEHWRH